MKIWIDRKPCECEKGEYLLTIAERNGIHIPTLCHHAALGEPGCCRVCMVEVEENGSKRLVTACIYPVSRECSVETDSDRVREQRGIILELLRRRAPDSPEIAALCETYGVPKIPRLRSLDSGRCILCGLCVEACGKLGSGAINTMLRGTEKVVGTPYREPSPDCIGCGSCAAVCPTGHIFLSQTEATRFIWGKTFRLVKCERCGAVLDTPESLAHAARRAGQPVPVLCEDCRQLRMTDEMAHTFGRPVAKP